MTIRQCRDPMRFRLTILTRSVPSAIPAQHISQTRPFIGRFWFIIYLKQAPSSGDSGSSYITQTRPLLRRFRLIAHLKHAPSFGDSGSSSGSSYLFNSPPPLFGDSHLRRAIPVYHIAYTHPSPTKRFRIILISDTRSHLAIPLHHICMHPPSFHAS